MFNSLFFFLNVVLYGQGVTNAHLSGQVINISGEPVSDVMVIANHVKSGTQYGTITDDSGYFYFRNVRVGGPYKVTASLFGHGETSDQIENIPLGTNYHMIITMKPRHIRIEEIAITAEAIDPLSLVKNNISKNLGEEFIRSIPNLNRDITSIFQFSAMSNNESFSGKNPRFNLVSLDGSVFTNSFGLGNTSIIGVASGAQPLSLEAIKEVQFNIAPYDLSQSGFTGTRINTVTKKGDNDLRMSFYTYYQNQNFIRRGLRNRSGNKGETYSNVSGVSISGPIIKDKLFVFVNYENSRQKEPATDYIAFNNTDDAENYSRVNETDILKLSSFLSEHYSYETGKYQDYSLLAISDKLLVNIDWNIYRKHKLNVRYNNLFSSQDNALSNSSIVGTGKRNNNPFSMSFENSNWIRNGKLHSILAELNSMYNNRLSSHFSLGYTTFDDSRKINGDLFPLVDIIKDGRTYISFGSDPFAQNNKLSASIFHTKGNISYSKGKHVFTLGLNVELMGFKNIYTPAWQGAYVYSSLTDFYNSTPSGTDIPIGYSNGTGTPIFYQKSYSLDNSQTLPEANPSFLQCGAFFQDQYRFSENLGVEWGLRIDQLSYLNSPLRNKELETLNFQDGIANTLNVRTDLLPSNQFSLSPRICIKWKPIESKPLFLRSTSGFFLGRIPFVFVADQFQNNGVSFRNVVLTETEQIRFTPEANEYLDLIKKSSSLYDIIVLDKDLKMPKIWRSSIGVDFITPNKIKGAIDIMYSKDIQALSVKNINIDNNAVEKNPVDGRDMLLNARLNDEIIQDAYYWQNVNKGHQVGFSVELSKRFNENLSGFVMYSWSRSMDINSIPGTNATSVYINQAVVGNPNKPELSFSQYDQPHKLMAYANFRSKIVDFGETKLTILCKAFQNGRFSYKYAGFGDVNGDNISSNDLIFVPSSIKQIDLEEYENDLGETISINEQWEALDNFIVKSKYLKKRRGQFAQRYGAILPWSFRLDLRLEQNVDISPKNHISVSLDFLNLINLLNSNWGATKVPANDYPIEATSPTTFRVYPENITKEFIRSNNSQNNWYIQVGIRYMFNKN